MKVGAAVSGPDDRIVPLPDGPQLLILDTDTHTVTRLPNPGYPLKTNRRSTTTAFLHGPKAPPGTTW